MVDRVQTGPRAALRDLDMAAGAHGPGRDDWVAGGLPAGRLAGVPGGEGTGRAFPVNPVRFSIDVFLLDQVVGDVIDDVRGGAELLLEHLGNLGEQKQPVHDGDVGRGAHGVQVAPSDVRVGWHEDEFAVGRLLPAL